MTAEPGYLYVLINPTMPGLAKVGKTTRDPSARVAELSGATGVATPFILVFHQPVGDCHAAEKWVHTQLEAHRTNANREFFNAAVHEIVPIVLKAGQLFIAAPAPRNEVGLSHAESNEDLLAEMYSLARDYDNGTITTLKNEAKALQLFEQAGTLGHAKAAACAAQRHHFGGPGVPKNPEKALAWYKKAVDGGCWFYLSHIAILFLEAKQLDAASAHWIAFIDAACQALDLASNADDPAAFASEVYQSVSDIWVELWCGCHLGKYPSQILDEIEPDLFCRFIPAIQGLLGAQETETPELSPLFNEARAKLDILAQRRS